MGIYRCDLIYNDALSLCLKANNSVISNMFSCSRNAEVNFIETTHIWK